MRAFVDAMRHWETGGRARALETMDLSQIRPASRDSEGWLQAQYMIEVINRVGAWVWQEIPDDPASREPYVFFSHPAGRIAIAPKEEDGAVRWRFTPDTVAAQQALFIATEAMPPVWGMPVVVAETNLFALRHSLLDFSPWFLARSAVGDFENWQVVALFMAITFGFLFAWIGVALLIRLVGAAFRLLGRSVDTRLERRLVWPLRLIAFALIWYRFRHRVGLVGPGAELLDSVAGVVLAVGVVWAGLPLVDALAAAVRSRRTGRQQPRRHRGIPDGGTAEAGDDRHDADRCRPRRGPAGQRPAGEPRHRRPGGRLRLEGSDLNVFGAGS
jgi:hypothetical protein